VERLSASTVSSGDTSYFHQPLTKPCRPLERFSVVSVDFAQKLHTLLLPHLPSFPYPTSMRRSSTIDNPRKPQSCNSNIRVYKYAPSQYFGYVLWWSLKIESHFFDPPFSRPHYDDSVHDVVTGAKSEWTLLIYLTGVEDGVEGGEVMKQYLPTFWKKLIDSPFL